jgi:hypothetical protein
MDAGLGGNSVEVVRVRPTYAVQTRVAANRPQQQSAATLPMPASTAEKSNQLWVMRGGRLEVRCILAIVLGNSDGGQWGIYETCKRC